MTRYTLDTTVLIDYLAGRPATVELVQSLDNEGHDLGVCCINVTELYSGVPERKRLVAAEFVDSLDYYDVIPDIAKLAGTYRFDFARKGITLSTSDCIIAAVAVANEATLITANVRDYPMPEIRILEQPR